MKETDEEIVFLREVLWPSLIRTCSVFEEGVRVMPSADAYGAPGVLLLWGEESLLISCAPWTDNTELLRYSVQEPGKWRWEFPAYDLPEKLPFFGRLPILYDRIRFGEPTPEDDTRSEAEKILPRVYAITRLPAFGEVLSELGMETVRSTDEDGTSCLVAVEGDVFIRFSYEDSIPELELTVLRIRTDEVDLRIPEYGNIRGGEEYRKLLGELF